MRRSGLLISCAAILWTAAVISASTPTSAPQVIPGGPVAAGALFVTADNCVACHNGLTTTSGEDISFGASWRASMMANAARDPYWMAAVRREILDHPEHQQEIEQECAVCHMPMAHSTALAAGRRVKVFENLPGGAGPDLALAADGVSCSMCHQIRSDRFGTRESFNGGFVIDTKAAPETRQIFGPFEVDPGRIAIMRSATGFVPAVGLHVRQSELCATCHTLYTNAIGPDGKIVGQLPEQVPFLEWQHSIYRNEQSCQSCHMPVVNEPVAVTSVMGQLREGVARHSFRGGNFFMLGLLNRYRAELGVQATPQEFEAAARDTVRFLQTETALLSVEDTRRDGNRLTFAVTVQNLSGHKFPTAYPSRRAWLHVTVRTADGQVVFESGKVQPNGAIDGNDNDVDGATFEPHYAEIRSADQVQIYEPIMVDPKGAVTTGLLTGVRYIKDNRLLPRGFAKETAHPDVAVHGEARQDPDFVEGEDRVRYSVTAPPGAATIDVVLRFQPIGFRWARNLEPYDAPEPQRFLRYYDSAATGSSETIAKVRVVHR